MKIAENLGQIRTEIARTAEQFNREVDSVCLLAVSKTRPSAEIIAAAESGQYHFGENYCQEAVDKITEINNPDLVWHFIGPIQSNKTRPIAEHFNWVHTVDRIKIATRLNDQRPSGMPPLNICVQINISEETSKSGINIDATGEFIEQLARLERIKVRGLMSLPAPQNDFEQQRVPFKKLGECLQQLQTTWPELDTLSMGTTHDMQAAIAEGATIVRIGTAIFGARDA